MAPPGPTVDIIIPVYKGAAETRACLASVLAAVCDTRREVCVIDDASPDAGIRAHLAGLEREGRITLLTNPRNLGFVASANIGIGLHPDRDIVLVNSDTEVADGWLDRLSACAHARPDAASATPFSNNATLASYPQTLVANPLAGGAGVGDLDRLFAAANRGKSIEIPTAVGFCMYMRRDALHAVGPFDAAAFGRGYGEENDWCMRARARGLVHLLCADTFVRHHGGVSFGAESDALKVRAQAEIDRRYPEYRSLVHAHVERDPARPLRRAVDAMRIATSGRPVLLLVTHGMGGGTERHVRELAAGLADAAEALILRPVPDGADTLCLEWARPGEEYRAWFDAGADWQALIETLRALGTRRMHLHHVHGLPRAILGLARALDVPQDITLHDYFPLTPAYHLRAEDRGDEDEAVRRAQAHPWGVSVAEWREDMRTLLAGATRVIAPSEDLRQRMQRHFPGLTIGVWPHAEIAPPPAPAHCKILLLGGLTAGKGLDVLVACAADAQARRLPLAFKLIGHTERPIPKWPDLPLFVHGSYSEDDLPTLIEMERGDAFFSPVQTPESYSYTLSAMMRTGLPVVASDLGSLPERLRPYPGARILPRDSTPRAWNEALLAACAARSRVPATPVEPAGFISMRDYLARYLAPVALDGTAASPGPAYLLPARHYQAPDRVAAASPHTLSDLFAAGVDCGHAESLRQLGQAIRMAEEESTGPGNPLWQREHALNVARRDAAEAMAATFRATVSWRVTRPLRLVRTGLSMVGRLVRRGR